MLRVRTLVWLLVVAAVMSPSAARADPPPDVSIQPESSGPFVAYDCNGTASLWPSRVIVGRGGDLAVPLEIAFTTTGDVTPASGTATFESGSDTVQITSILPSSAQAVGSAFTFSLTPSPAYVLAGTTSVTLDVGEAQPSCVQGPTTTVVPNTLARTGHAVVKAVSLVGFALAAAGGLLLVAAASMRRNRT